MNDELKAHFTQSILDFAKQNVPQAPREAYGSSIMYLTNPDSQFFALENNLRNRSINDKGEMISIGKPLCNDECINMIRMTVQSAMNQVTFLSNFDEKEVDRQSDMIHESICFSLSDGSKYGVPDHFTRSMVVQITTSYARAALKRALNQGERGFWSRIEQNVTSTIVNKDNKKGVIGMFKDAVGLGG